MKQYFLYLMMGITLIGCNTDLESEGLSRITYYPEFVLEGEDFIILEPNEPYAEPGIEVLEQGNPISFESESYGRYSEFSGINTVGDEIDQYSVVYSAVNKDGFASSFTRTVVRTTTGDFLTGIEGVYLSKSARVTPEVYEDLIVMIFKNSENEYEISCALGGFYSDGRELGDDYLVPGCVITLTDLPNGEFTYTTEVERGDGLAFEVSDMVIDTENRKITFHVSAALANGDWDITLVQVQP